MASKGRGAPSTIAGWSAVLVRALEASGVDGRKLAAQAGIATAQLSEPAARVPRAALTRLWQLAVEATGDPCFGLTASKFLTPTTLHALGYATLASATLKEALERIIRYRRLIGDVVDLRLIEERDRYRFVIDVSAPPGAPYEAVDALASGWARQARVLRGDPGCSPLMVLLRRPQPSSPEPFARAFQAPVKFGQPINALEYSRADLEAPLPSSNAELARQSDEVVQRYVDSLGDTEVLDRVRQAVLEALPNGAPSKGAVALKLGMGPRTLQRRLAEHGRSFREMVDDARLRLACSYLDERRLSITEIAFVLGFADTATFSRAFKRWTGRSPRHRKLHAPSPKAV